ncbi:MAG: BBE domain-containing protein, partial [Acidimicrobiia bacterium]
AGLIAWPASEADAVLRLYRTVVESAPRELTTVVLRRNAPPAPWLPEDAHGTPIIVIVACHTGDLEQAQADLAPIKSHGTPLADLIQVKTYVAQQSLLDATQPKGMHYYWKSEFLPGLSGALLDTYRDRAAAITSPLSQAVIFQFGGAVADHDSGVAAFGNRDAAYGFFAAGGWPPGDPNADRHLAWVRTTWEAIRPHSTGSNYVNWQTPDEDDTRLREAYGDHLGRLAGIKSAYDPDNLFRVNRNIRPADRRPTVGVNLAHDSA